MKIHEFQASALLAQAGVPVPPGRAIESVEAAAGAYKQVAAEGGTSLAVVKAQVHAGGRGKAGFVKLVRSERECVEAARFMLTHRMVSPQTPPGGLEVRRLLVAAGVDIAHEYYVAITLDRAKRRAVLIASAEGGVEIEKTAHERPEAIVRQVIHPLVGLQPHQARRVAFALGFTGKAATQAAGIMLALSRVYHEQDCSLAEINPLVLTRPAKESPEGRVVAIDAKFNFDDNALFRHKAIADMFDASEEPPAEQRAKRFDLSYIALDGTIGCLVNGAGLAMATMDIIKHEGGEPANFLDVGGSAATMDIIKHEGGEPANFLDVGGSASEEAVTEGFRIILSDRKVRGVLVNIFGGIMRCDVIAQAIVNAAKETGFSVPLVVRLEGTNVEAGRKILSAARGEIPTMQAAGDLGEAARMVVKAAG